MLPVLQAIWQADGTFPSGSFAFSYGIEGIVALRGKIDAPALADITAAILRQRWEPCDRIALVRAFRTNGDVAAIVAVEPGRITRLVDDGASIRTAARDGSEIYYRVMLDHVPISENLYLKCNWIDPAGRIVKQNSWATKTTGGRAVTMCRWRRIW